MSSIGERITEARKKKRISQLALADQIHTSIATVRGWELGMYKPSADSICMLCQALDVDANYILGMESKNGANGTVSAREDRSKA